MPNSFKNHPILVVDDHLENIQVVGKLLKDQGYIVYFSRNGEEALDVVRNQPVQLVLLDVMMPGMDGFETAQRMIKLRAPEFLPIIFLTALNEKDQVIKGFEVGGVDYITKPFNRGELLARVRTHLSLQKAQHEIQEKNKALEEANKGRDRFFSILAHDLKSPISGIFGLLDEATHHGQDFSKEDYKDVIEALHQSSIQVYHLLNSLLSWGKSQVLSKTLTYEDIPLDQLINSVLLDVQGALTQKEIRIDLEVTPQILKGHRASLETILRNLVQNAIKFSSRCGSVEIRSWKDDDFHFLSVKDFGIGMSQVQISKLFKIDEKVSTLGTEKEAGTGLGLILSQELAQRHRGTLKVESEKSKGTDFTLILPLNPS